MMKRGAIFLVLLLSIELAVLGEPTKPAHATHGSYVVQPVYFYAADMTNRFNTYQTKLNNYMAETNTWYANAHLQSGDKFAVNAITYRQGSQNKSYYCSGMCEIKNSLFNNVFNDLANPSPSAYLGYDPWNAKNVITFVFFDTIPASSTAAALGNANGLRSPYDPEGYGGTALTGSYVMDAGSIGTPGHDGTIAHELGHTLRLNHNNVSGTCALMYGLAQPASCWNSSTFLVNSQQSDGYWYLEKYAVHYSSFTRRDSATSPARLIVASKGTGCAITIQWSVVSGDSMTDQAVLIAPRSTLAGGDVGNAIFVSNIYTGQSRQVAYVGTSTTQHTFSSGLHTGYYHFTVATINSIGQVHGWPDGGGFYLSC